MTLYNSHIFPQYDKQMHQKKTDITLLLLKLVAFTRSSFDCINKTLKIILDNVPYFDVYKHNNSETGGGMQ